MGNKQSQKKPEYVRCADRGKLGVFFEEPKTPASPAVFSFDCTDVFVNGDRVSSMVDSGCSSEEYPFLDEKCFLVIGCFLRPKELSRMSMISKRIYHFFQMNRFWKKYFFTFYRVRSESWGDDDGNIDWKKLFFERFLQSDKAEFTYRNLFKPKLCEEEIRHASISISILGSKNVNTVRLIRTLLNDFEGEECEGEKTEKTNSKQSDVVAYSSVMRVVIEKGITRTVELSSIFNRKHEDYKNSIKDSSGFVLCFEINNRKSFEALPKYMKDAKKVDKKRKQKGRRYNVILVGMKSHSRKREVMHEEVQELVSKKNLKGYVEVSLKRKKNLFLPFGVLIEKTISRMFNEYSSLKRGGSLKNHY